MMYSTTVQIFEMKYVILEATQKWQILTNVGGFKSTLFTFLDSWICEFCTTQNIESFVLHFVHSLRVHHWLPIEFVFLIFLNGKCHFRIFEKKWLHSPSYKMPHSSNSYYLPLVYMYLKINYVII
jgi:ABC-type uncharacterized transport system permease subunit